MRMCVLGTGYVGLVAGACFSDSGNHVICVDLDQDKISRLNKGEVPIYEPGLEDVIARNTKAKRLSFSDDPKEAIGKSEIVFIAVGTPPSETGAADMRFVHSAAKMIKDFMKQEMIVVLKSTVPVGTSDKVREILKGSKSPVDVVSNPEFLKEGTAVNDFFRPERVVIGCDSERSRQVMGDLYAPYIRSGNPIFFMDNRSAELSKYAANSFLAMKISFINDLANLSERVGANIHDVRKALVSDSRIGSKFLYAGVGYGGSCFPKDVQAIIQLGKESEMPLGIFAAVHQTNEKQKRLMFEKIKKYFKGNLAGKKVAIWGLSFKPETDDMREAPSVTLIQELLKSNATVQAYDPVAGKEAKKLFEDQIALFDDAYEAVKGADVLAILTEWNEFRSPDFSFLKKELKDKAVFDGRNLYNRESLTRHGLVHFCVGRPDPV